ncbi:MAG: energy transducer TonB [Gammaproteobacteria bacterium]|nr:energy transducer TonB [Gammaproteobacteria bacterium]
MINIDHKHVRTIAILWMLAGSAVVLLMLLLMNHFSDRPEKEKREYSSQFEVKQPKKLEPKKETVKKVKKQTKIIPQLMHEMDANIAGLDLGLPAFTIGAMDDGGLLGDTNNVVMTSDMVDTAAHALTRTPVDYPRRAKSKDIEGYVIISLLINKSGQVATAKVIESEPSGIFEEKALQTIKTWIFEPAKYKGRAVDSWANQTIRFELS